MAVAIEAGENCLQAGMAGGAVPEHGARGCASPQPLVMVFYAASAA